MGFFSKKPSKKYNTADDDEEEAADFFTSEPPSPSPSGSPTKSPYTKPKPSSSRKPPRPSSPDSQSQLRDPKPRSSRTFVRQSTDPGSSSSSSRRKKIDPDIHPLNLPPEQRKRLSALSAMSSRNSMDVDYEQPSSAPSSPALQTSQHAFPGPSQPSQQPASQKPSQQPPQANLHTVPVSNGTNGAVHGTVNGDDAPAPPPHRSQPTSPVPSAADQAEQFKIEGNKFFQAKDFKRAIEQYSRAVELQPDSPTYLSNRAAANMSAGKYEAALEDCRRAADLDPDNPKILLRLARIYTSLGQPEEALATFGRIHPPPSAKDTAPARDMLRHINSARDAFHAGTAASMVLYALDLAEKHLGVGALKPRKWQLMRGEALLKMGDVNSLGETQNIAMSLLRINNNDPEAIVLRGRALYAQGENDKAVQHFRKALSFDPELKEAVKWLRIVQKLERMKEEGNVEFKAGRYQAAIEKYTRALEVDPSNRNTNSKILQNRALCENKLKRYNEAIDDCDKALNLDPQYNKARKTKASALGLAERWEEAVREWKAIQETDPSDRGIANEVRKAELELKKSKRKDYYKILDVPKDADEQTIKKAYRKLAIVHHPDKNPGDEQAEARFKDISEAYETLSDPQKRQRYDNGDDLADMSDMFGGGAGMAGGIDPEIIFQMMGGQGGGFGGGFPGGGGGGFPGGATFSFGGNGRPRQRGGGFPGGGFPGGFQFS